MADTLEIFGIEYANVNGIKAIDDNGDTITFTKSSGSTVESGNFTPSSNTLSFTISELVGTTLTHFFVKPTGNSNGPLGHSVRCVGPGFIDFTSGSECCYSVISNSSGSSFSGINTAATAGTSSFGFDRSTGTLTVGNTYLISGIQYDWWAW